MMPSETGLAFVLVPHLDPEHKSLMVEIIARHTSMPVLQVEDPTGIEANHIYIVRPNYNLTVEEGKLVPVEIPKNRGINLPVDIFFRSLAVAQKERAIGVILSGTMRDGAMGLKDIKEHGGLVIAQSPDTAQHDGMPQSAIDTGMVDFVLPIKDMPDAILKFIAHPHIHGESLPEYKDDLHQVLAVIQSRAGHDFRCYKRNTLVRRIERRMGLRQIERMSDYVKILKNDPPEIEALLKDLLIGVTGFFREEDVWDKLRNEILPDMLLGRDTDKPIRVWIPGCSTGEEAYTIALLIHDAFDESNMHFNAQIFGTDIDGEAINSARKAVYPETIAANVPEKYLKKYFVYEDGEYHIIQRVHESVVFSEQNLVGDAPFSNLSLISCRNLLIYLNSDIQKKIIELFHFALLEEGVLILGNSETIGYHHDLFETVSKQSRIYRRIGERTERIPIPVMGFSGRYRSSRAGAHMDLARKDISKLMQTELLKRFAPVAVLVDKNYEILNLHGPATRFLDLPQGEPIMELTSMVKEGLRLKLRGAMHKASKTNETVTVHDARVKRERRYYPVSLTIIPISKKSRSDTLYLITFEDQPVTEEETGRADESYLGEDHLVKQLEAELTDTREDLQNTIKELETSNEEMKASNEEMMSMNEELQSSNEELETSKEESQSMNEELNTVNAELREKVSELETANNDIANLMNSTEVATVFLDVNMEIRRFTPAAKKLFNLIPSDVGLPIGDLSMRFNDSELQHDAMKVMETLVSSVKEVSTDEGNWYVRRILPFRTQEMGVDGLVLTFSDVTELKDKEIALTNNEKLLKQHEAKYRELVQNANSAIIRWKVDGAITFFNEYAQDFFGYEKNEILGKNVGILVPEEESTGKDLTGLVRLIVEAPEQFKNNINENIRKDGSRIWMTWTNRPVYDESGNVMEILAVGSDITALKDAETALSKSEKEKRLILDNADELIAYHDKDHNLIWANRVYLEATGKPLSQLKGNKCFHSWGMDEFCHNCPVIRAVETGKPQSGELTPENQAHWSEAQGSWDVKSAPVKDNEGNIIGAIEIARDITEQKKAQSALMKIQEEKEFLADLLNRSSQPFAIGYPDGRLGLHNMAYERLTGYSSDELGKMDWETTLTPPEWLELEKKKLEVLHDTGKPVRYEKEYIHKDGTRIPVDMLVHLIRDENGQPLHYYAFITDISERKKTEEFQKALSFFPKENPNPVLRCSVEQDLLYANASAKIWLESLGWRPDKSLPESVQNLLNKAGKEGHATEADITSPTGKTFSVFAVQPEGEKYVNLYGIDITGRKKAETALKRAHDNLEKKIRERTAELEWRNRELKEFAYVASHDLQEPLRKIKLFAEMAEKELKEVLTEQGQDYLRRMNNAADRMQKLVKSLLTYSRASTKSGPFERVDLKSIVNEVAKDMLPENDSNTPVIEITELPEIDADPVQMYQLFQNLLGNSIRYHKEAQTPEVKIFSCIKESDNKQNSNVCEITVEDNGIGFDMAYIDKIFLPFERLHGRDSYEGTGMGLAICRKIAERHGGQISAKSIPGEGSAFTVTLPMRQFDGPE